MCNENEYLDLINSQEDIGGKKKVERDMIKKDDWWDIGLDNKPDFEKCIERIYAWFEQEIIDRPPIRFVSNNQMFRDTQEELAVGAGKKWKTFKDRWYDTQFRVDYFIKCLERETLLGENLPIFWPDFSPHFLAGLYGADLKFGEITAWAGEPIIKDYSQLDDLSINKEGILFKKANELISYALERCKGKFIVGYPDIYPGLDCIDALKGTENTMFDLFDRPEELKELIQKTADDAIYIFNYFYDMLKEKKQLSCNWMGIPTFEKFFVTACDFSTVLSNQMFEEYVLPSIKRLTSCMDHNIFHLDGKGVAKHIDYLLQIPEIDGIQWVQGMGKDRPILQWIPLIKKILKAGKSIIVDVNKEDLEEFINAIKKSNGLFLFIESNFSEEQERIIKRIERW